MPKRNGKPSKAVSLARAIIGVKQAMNDCSQQADALENAQELTWDVYDFGNWDSMANNLEEVLEFLERQVKKKPTNAEKFIKSK